MVAANGTEILIVEDDEVIMGTLAYNLSREGFSVNQSTTGAEALRAARKLRPDLILLDIMLPGESGIEVCEHIREAGDEEVVIIMITAKDAEEDKVRGFEAGADDYVTKPFGIKELLARITANLKRSDAGQPGTGYRIRRPPTRHQKLYGPRERRGFAAAAERVRTSRRPGLGPRRVEEPGGAGEGGVGARRRRLLAHDRPYTSGASGRRWPRAPGTSSSTL